VCIALSYYPEFELLWTLKFEVRPQAPDSDVPYNFRQFCPITQAIILATHTQTLKKKERKKETNKQTNRIG
jgi:hypothetical protein